ncbi:unnamed protein product [Rhodiola kirilowii]
METHFQETNSKFEKVHAELKTLAFRPSGETSAARDDDKGILGASPPGCIEPIVTGANTIPLPRRTGDFYPKLKLDFPTFSPTNPRYWIRKCEKYFAINEVDKGRKVELASLHLDEEAEIWFDGWSLQYRHANWPRFVEHLCQRFGTRSSGNVVEEFNHLKQAGNVNDYIQKFEELMGMMIRENPNLSDRYFVYSFVGGLNDAIKSLVRTHNPESIGEAIEKARLHELALKAISKASSIRGTSATFPQIGARTQVLPSRDYTPLRKEPSCYKCGEKWFKGHMCKSRQVNVIEAVVEGSNDIDEPPDDNLDENDGEGVVELSMHAINGSSGSGTLKLKGMIRGKPILILLDTGSTTPSFALISYEN